MKRKKIKIPNLKDVEPSKAKKVKDLITPEIGIYKSVPFEEYLKWDCFSKSAIKSLKTSPRHYLEYRNTPINTKAIKEGRLLDCMLLEPELFDDQFIIPPDKYLDYEKKPTTKTPEPKKIMKDWSPYSAYCKKWKVDAESHGLTVVKEEDVQKAINCMGVIASKDKIKEMFEGEAQVSIVWDDPMTGVRCKARFDILGEEGINDLKKTKDASYSDEGTAGFKGEIAFYDYDAQAALYQDGWYVLTGELKPFSFIAVEYFPPFECAAYPLREDSLINGRIKYRQAQEVYTKIIKEDRYEGYPNELIDIDIPMYKMIDRDKFPVEKMNYYMGLEREENEQ